MDSSEIRDYTAQFGGGDSAQGVLDAPQHSKAVILSFYDKGNDGYFWKLVKSVRFTPSGCAAGRGGR